MFNGFLSRFGKNILGNRRNGKDKTELLKLHNGGSCHICKNSRIIRLFGFESIKKKCLLFLFYSLSCPSSGHSWTKRWASTEQATGTHCPCGVHRVPKRWAIFGHLLQVGGFAIMHDASWLTCSNWMTFFMILLWYFYDTSCKIIQNVSFFYLIMYQLFVSVFSQQDDTLILFT